MIGNFLWADGQLKLVPGNLTHPMKMLMDAKSSNFCAGEFHLDDHGPDFDSLTLEWEAGKCPTDNDLRRMIRLEVDNYGREARYRKRVADYVDDIEEWAWENLQDAGYVRIPFLLTSSHGLLMGKPGGEHGDIEPFGAMGKQGEVYFYSDHPPRVALPHEGYWADWQDSDVELLKEQIFERAREEVGDFEGEVHLAATSEDTEPVGKDVGFLRDPRPNLYPPLFQGSEEISPDVIGKLKAHVLNALEPELPNPDQFIYFTIYGSGISYNWDEAGDMDIQMWVDIEKYEGDDMTSDDLIATIRRIVQPINFPTFNDVGLESPDDSADGSMMIQYYPKPGRGTPEENLASKPYACYDLETGEWLEKAKPITPTFYGEHFLMLEPKCEDIALQAEALIGELERNILNWQFWYSMYERFDNDHYRERYEKAQQNAEQEKAGVVALFEGVFGGRAKAYSPEGKGIEDERDMVQKMLEVWGIFQKLKHYAREELPWEEKEMPKEASSAQEILQQGGGTLKVVDMSPDQKSYGFYVALDGMEEKVPIEQFSDEVLQWYATDIQTDLVGFWVNDGHVFLDNVQWIESPHEATMLGQQNNQQAIWDIRNQREIWLKGAGWKIAMAERTGDPTLDVLIEEFKAHSILWNDGEDDLPISVMSDPIECEGMCGEITTAWQNFVWYETDGKIMPENIEMTDGSFHDWNPRFEDMGYGDRKPGGEPGHLVSKIKMPSGTYLIDWTASQYGYSEFPMVQRLDGEQWQRQWTSKKGAGWTITSMAERTGDPDIDALIDQFMTENQTTLETLEGEGFQPLEDMGEPRKSWGWCHVLASQFAEYLKDNGVEAWSSEDEHGPEGINYRDLGYGDMPGAKGLGIIKFHCVTYIEKDGARYMVDWTASQYGYSEFPMVQRLDGERWQRQWTSKKGAWIKEGDWQEIQDKATRLRETGVTVLRNGFENVVGEVPSESRPGMMHYPEIWRQDPSRGTITLWDCTCEWAGYSWGRTRQWKKFEGRPCAHVLALFWESSTMPIEDDEQTFMPTPEEQIPPPGQLTDALRATVPGQPQQAPVIPGSQPGQPQRAPASPVSELTTVNDAEQLQLTMPGTFSRWYRASNFTNGDYVRSNVKVDGYDDRGTYYVVPRNMIGEVLWADEDETIVIFSIQSKALGPHNVKVTAPSESFSLVPRTRGTAPKRRR